MRVFVLLPVSLLALAAAAPGTGARGQAAPEPAPAASAPASAPGRGTLKPESFEVIEVKLSPAAVLGGAEPNAPGNAADDYRKAIQACDANAADIAGAMDRMDEIAAGTCTPPPAVVKVLEKVLEHVTAGAAKKEMQFTAPGDIAVRYADDRAARLVRVSEALGLLANVYYAAKDYEKVERVLRAKLVMGWHMAGEHVRATMCLGGLEVQGRAAGTMVMVYDKWNKDDRAEVRKAAAEYVSAVGKASKAYRGKFFQVWKVTPEPDNVFAVAEADKDRAWRVEAMLLCGVIRFTHSDDADVRKSATKWIGAGAKDADPFVKAAAAAARDLTKKAYDHVSDPAER